MNPKIVNNLTKKIKKNVPSILSYAACIGVIATGVMVAKETTKIEEIKNKKLKEKEEISKNDLIKIYLTNYLPSIFVCGTTIACILGANVLNKKKQEALIGAYMIIQKSFNEYKEKTKELYGNEAEENVRIEIAREHMDEVDVDSLDEDKELFYDEYSGRYFESTVKDVIRAEYDFNRNFILRDYACLNEFYDFLGLERIDIGDSVGWTTYAEEEYGYRWVDFNHDKIVLDDGLECYILTFPFGPTSDFMNL